MSTSKISIIDELFVREEDGDFVRLPRDAPYTLVAPVTTTGNWVYTTKPNVLLRVIGSHLPDALGVVGRAGLPHQDELKWLCELPASGLFFAGDLDPVDLLTFAWLREFFGSRFRVEYRGITDETLSGLGGVQQIEIPLSRSEARAIKQLDHLLPDLQQIVGRECHSLLHAGLKIELEGMIALGADRMRRTLLAASTDF